MAQHPRPDHANTQHVVRNGTRAAALLAVAAATGLVAVLLTLRVLAVAGDLPSPRFETYLEIPLVGTGGLLAAWVSLSSALAASCVLVRSAGRRWAAGERLVLQHAPAIVRRLASTGVAVSIGAGLALGAGTAQAAEADPVPRATSPGVVDLGWQSTSPGSPSASDPATAGGGPSTVPRSAEDEATTALPAPELPAPGTRQEADVATPSPGSAVPVPDVAPPVDPASVSEVPQDHRVGTTADPPPGTPTVGRTGPDHVPLSDLLGGSQRAAPEQRVGLTRPAATAPDDALSEESATAARSPLAASEASTVSVVVLRGDSLWSLAGRALGPDATDAEITAEWPRWYAANAETIGQDPNLIRPGQVLQVPRTP
ncbi:LysM peptidoglycan-binding domain-containing protein [Oerskovia jenensis]|uniref:Nucleoid-associated protein YgaU n=1 Tax=Oerskovia jenensis TaxID=162169 RepID=A0ABS2LJ18_9CELL|nr:hypothetical protein [Oerskovia jenensis]MBM7480414.1 nucleoid-associated protein YgaU [Oerskovia jenensis]